jgi:hypothetical protein
MRRFAIASAALLVVACGPDPNAHLPGTAVPSSGGHTSPPTSSGGSTTTSTSSGGNTTTSSGGSGGSTPFGTGGATATGGTKSTGGSGGAAGAGAKGGSGGGAGGSAGSTSTSGIDSGSVSPDCPNPLPVTSTGAKFDSTSAVCFITCESSVTYGWGCDSFTETQRTVTVNGTAVKCGASLPAAKGGYYTFQIGAGGNTWDAIHLNGSQGVTCTAPTGGAADAGTSPADAATTSDANVASNNG